MLTRTLAVYPGGQVHVKLPGVFAQVAMGLQPPLFTAHSSISATSSQVRQSTMVRTKIIHSLSQMFEKFTTIIDIMTVLFVVETHSQARLSER